ncbi:NAD(P)-binding protein [Dichomitus squalens]|uniref:NAD(P)-binding protein n=1 Tax=Dichomitus squalens TaxID=114155 RepID=A0A4Q9N1B6_9APHY|nr:NAD(P)-binding protein [Dichomitus squalens]TBU61684.1 NAD(P)-binding protein [Dichomitus squalens]
MPSLAAVRAANAAFSPSYFPVAVFVGGTAGIGKAIAQSFARVTKGNAHIVIVGRNKAAAESVIASFPKPTAPEAKHEFVACEDAALMRSVRTTTSTLLERLPKINFLVISAGFWSWKGRDETDEGIDRRLGLHYYARWKFIHDLLPLLRKAKDAGEDAKAISVLAAGVGGTSIDVDNLGLRKNYIMSKPGVAGPTYTDLMMQSYAEQNPGLSFVHTYPGIVRSELLTRSHWSMRVLNPLLQALFYPVSYSPEDCGEYMLYALLQAPAGVARYNAQGDDIGRSPLYDAVDVRTRLWEHTKEEVEGALAKHDATGA